MKKWSVIAFGFGVGLSCTLWPIDAGADAKRYTILMEALGRNEAYEISPQTLDDLEEFLVGTGTPRSQAQEAISTALRAPFIKLSAITQIVPLARDIGAVMGTGVDSEIRELLAAFGRGGESVVQYCIARNALSAEQITNIRYLDQHAHSAEALTKALDRLQDRFGGSYERLRNASGR